MDEALRRAEIIAYKQTFHPSNLKDLNDFTFLIGSSQMTFSTTWQVLRQVERRFHNWDSHRQPLFWDLGISPPSSSSLRSSRTTSQMTWTTLFKVFRVTYGVASLTLFWGVCKVTLMINNFIISVIFWHLAFMWTHSYPSTSMFDRSFGVWLCYIMVYKFTKVYTIDTWH
jgi:hypothetical protein